MRRCQKLNKNQIKELNKFIDDSNRSGREVRRTQAVIMINENVSISTITALTKYKRRQIYKLRRNYLKHGLSTLEDKRKGKPKELLTKKQRQEIIEIVKTKTPNQIDSYYNSDYWSTGILGEYIKRTFNTEYKSKTSIYLIFKQSKFTYHKPGRVYNKRDEQEVKEWQKKTNPIIKKAMKDKNTVILCEDEMILSTQTTFQKIWLPKNNYPKIEISNDRKNRSIYGFLNIKTDKEHSFKSEKQNMYITKDILEKIRKIYQNQKLLILWDGAGWHRGSVVQEFIKRDKRIKTIYFPRYAPEQNPQEHVWKNGRDKVTHNRFIQNIDVAADEFVDYLNKTEFPYKLLGVSARS